jgi:hypothetical protein
MVYICSQSDKKLKAITLRKKGYTYNEIIGKVHIAKSTLSDWVNAEIDKDEEKRLKQLTAKRGLEKIIRINKLRSKRIQEIEKITQLKYASTIKKIDRTALFWIGMGLYLAEGAKTGRWKPIFYNSDPVLNQLMRLFFKKICNVPENKIHIQLVLHKNISEEKAKKYWSKILRVPLSSFNNASYIQSKASKGKRPINSLPYGTVQIAVGGKEFLNMIKGWSLGITNQVNKCFVKNLITE